MEVTTPQKAVDKKSMLYSENMCFGMRHGCIAVLCFFLGGGAFANSLYTQSAPCAPSQSVCDIGIAADTSTPAVTVSDMIISQPGAFIPNDGNNNIMITLIGFQFPESGDLTVTLTELSTGFSADLFSRLGATNPSDP